MNKKIVVICLLFVIVLMSACTNGKTSKDDAANHKEENNVKDSQQKEKEAQSDTKEESGDDQAKQEDVPVNKEESQEPKYTINQKNWLVQPIDKTSPKKVVLLTIDDAPDKYAVDMAQTFKELGVGAIFFVNGHFLETSKGKDSLKKIHDMGFMIGNHTYSHAYLPDLSEEEQRKEIVRVNEMVKEIIGEKPLFFRAPNGANTDYTKQLADQEGMTLMNWSYGYDWHKKYSSKEAITDIMLHTKLLGSGSNLLMHDRKWTSEALHDIVVGLQDKGYGIVDPHLIKTK